MSVSVEGKSRRCKPQSAMEYVWFVRALLWCLFIFLIFGTTFIILALIEQICWAVLSLGGLAILIILLPMIWAKMYYASYWYEIKDAEIVVESGVWFRKKSIIPFKRIQNVNVVQGPLMRLWDLKSIQIETAGAVAPQAASGVTGTGFVEGQIPGPEEPDKLADEIIEKVKAYKSAEGL
ncbi:MAG: PH domain-containing protein [Candidatus Thermoplasmatota archaeon]